MCDGFLKKWIRLFRNSSFHKFELCHKLVGELSYPICWIETNQVSIAKQPDLLDRWCNSFSRCGPDFSESFVLSILVRPRTCRCRRPDFCDSRFLGRPDDTRARRGLWPRPISVPRTRFETGLELGPESRVFRGTLRRSGKRFIFL